MAKYSLLATMQVRHPKPETKRGYGWKSMPKVLLEGDSIEEITEKAYAIPAPDDIETQAIHIEGTLHLMGAENTRDRRNVRINVFREL